MIESVFFEVKKWDYNKNAPTIKPHTDFYNQITPLKNKATLDTDGLCIKWTLTIQMDKIERLYYLTEEWIVIPNKETITDNELLEVVKKSYDKSYLALIPLNIKAGLDAYFLPFNSIDYDLEGIRNQLK